MHYSVMKTEAIEALNLKETGIIVDATVGYAGHSSEILKRVKRGFLFAFDQDKEAISYSINKLKLISDNFEVIKSNFVNIQKELNKRDIYKVDGILYDLGVSSPQLDNGKRGFSYHYDAKLDMRMDQSSPISAYEVINNYSEDKLREIVFRYGEEKYAKSIARNIVTNRSLKPIETTLELVDIIKQSMPYKETIGHHPARKTFQAIRIEVNHELDVLEKSIRSSLDLLSVNGRMVVITFHSLEDRIVKEIFREVTSVNKIVKGFPNIPDEYLPNFRLVNNKAIEPSINEVDENNRSRSSKLRVIERIK